MITFAKMNLNNSYYFCENMKNIDQNLLSINKKRMKNTDAVVYEMKYIMMQNIDKEVPLCLSFSDVDTYIIEENESKYLILALIEDNKGALELYKKL